MMTLVDSVRSLFLEQSHLVLFFWSLVCYTFGLLSAVILHYYFLHLVIVKADKILQEIKLQNRRIGDRKDPPSLDSHP